MHWKREFQTQSSVGALSRVTIEYKGNRNLTLQQQIAKLSEIEGLEWMTQVHSSTQGDVDWVAINDKYERWKESNTSMSPAFAAVVAVAVAIAMGPAGLNVGGMIAGSATWPIAAAINAGAVALASQATMAVINGAVSGDIEQAMEDFASDETLKSLAVTMVTAGAKSAIHLARV